MGGMNLFELFSVAFALSIDSFAVSAAGGCTRSKIPAVNKLAAAATFAAVQTFMTFAGWVAGEHALSLFENVMRYAAAAVLFVLGLKMLRDAFKSDDGNTQNFLLPLKAKILLLLGVATSLDALAVGVSFAFMNVDMARAAAVIAATTVVMCLSGIELGKSAARLSKHLPILGGVILIAVSILGFFNIG